MLVHLYARGSGIARASGEAGATESEKHPTAEHDAPPGRDPLVRQGPRDLCGAALRECELQRWRVRLLYCGKIKFGKGTDDS